MKPPASLLRAFLLSSVTLLTLPTAFAQNTYYWDGGIFDIFDDGDGVSDGGAGTWDTALLNWDAGEGAHVPWNNGTNDTAIFGGTGAAVTVGEVTVGGIGFEANGYSISTGTITFGTSGTIGIDGGNSATLNSIMAGAASAAITKTGEGQISFGNNLNTFGGQLTIADGILRIPINPGGVGVVVNANGPLGNSSLPIILGSTEKTGTLFIDSVLNQPPVHTKPFTLATGGSGGFQISGGTQTISGIISGDGRLVKTGAGALSLSGTNTYSGETAINAGTLQFNSAAAIGGSGRSITVATAAVVSAGYAIDNAFLNRVVENDNASFVRLGVNSNEDLDFSSSTGANLPNAALYGLGAVGTGATITFGGTLTPNSNTFRLAALNKFTITLPLDGDDNSLLVTSGPAFVNNGNRVILGAAPTYGGTTTVGSGAMLQWGTAFNSNISLDGLEPRSITVESGGTLIRVSPDNAFLGKLAENNNAFTINMFNAAATNVDFSEGGAGAYLPNVSLGSYTQNDGFQIYTGTITPANNTYRLGDNRFTYNGNTSYLHMGNLNALTDSATAARSLVVHGRVQLTNANDFSGDTTILNPVIAAPIALNRVSLVLGNNLSMQNSALDTGLSTDTGKAGLVAAVTTPTLGGLKGSRNLSSVITAGYTGVTNLILNPGTGKSHTYAGIIGDGAPGMSLTKTGEGSQVLNATHTYTGETFINAGTLVLDASGSIDSSASVTIGAGATLDTAALVTYFIPATQPLTFGIDSTDAGSCGQIVAAGLDIEEAEVTYSIPATLNDSVYVLATYTSLTGSSFASVSETPAGYILDYAYEDNKIALLRIGGEPAPTLISIVDNQSGGPITAGTLVTYTVTFSEAIDPATVSEVDFSNAGTSNITIGTINETAAGVFSVQVTPTSEGTLILQIPVSATLTNLTGTFLVNDPALLDDTTITVTATAADPYLAWSNGAAFGDDANADGVENGLAWLLGAANATAAANSLLPTITQSGGNLVLGFSCLNSDNRSGAVLSVEYSSDLGRADLWKSAAVPETNGVINGVTFSIIPGSPSNAVTATIPGGEAAGGKLFGRLKAEPAR